MNISTACKSSDYCKVGQAGQPWRQQHDLQGWQVQGEAESKGSMGVCCYADMMLKNMSMNHDGSGGMDQAAMMEQKSGSLGGGEPLACTAGGPGIKQPPAP